MIYGYRCEKCDHEFELSRHNSEYKSPADCPDCGTKDGGKRILGTPFFVTAGGGHKNKIR